MRYGLIGKKLSHSFSGLIHDHFGLYKYELKEIAPEDLERFMVKREFYAINVTIPYKEDVMPYRQRSSAPSIPSSTGTACSTATIPTSLA